MLHQARASRSRPGDIERTGDQLGPYSADETITGKFAKDSVSFTAIRATDGLVTTLDNAPFGGAVTIGTVNVNVPWVIEMKVTQPIFTASYTNHGDYVSQMGGGAEAAHSPIGKPIKAVAAARRRRREQSRLAPATPTVRGDVAAMPAGHWSERRAPRRRRTFRAGQAHRRCVGRLMPGTAMRLAATRAR